MSQRLDTLDSEFKCHHYGLIDLIEDEEGIIREQDILDEHDDNISVGYSNQAIDICLFFEGRV